MAFDPASGQVILFGGGGSSYSSATYAWDGATWSRVLPAVSPSPRGSHSMVTDRARGEIVLFGGRTATTVSDETWVWRGGGWVQLQPAHRPSARYRASMTFDPDRGSVWLFGGYDQSAYRTDLWEWDGADWTEHVSDTSLPRMMDGYLFHDAVAQEGLVLYGSDISSNNFVATTWSWDGRGWRMLADESGSPPPRSEAALVLDEPRGRVVLFGGRVSGSPLYSDETWEWGAGRWVLRRWAASPPVRARCASTYDPLRGEVLIQGGVHESGRRIDTWAYRVAITDAASWVGLGGGCAGTAGTPTLEAVTGREPWIGESAKLRAQNLPSSPFAQAFGLLGLTDGSWAGRTLPSALDDLGLTGCVLHLAPEDTPLLPRTGSGEAVWRIPLPRSTALVGVEFGVQCAVLDAGANALGLTLSNALRGRVGAR